MRYDRQFQKAMSIIVNGMVHEATLNRLVRKGRKGGKVS